MDGNLHRIIQKIRRLELRERRCGDRATLVTIRRDLIEWHSRLHQEIRAIPLRRLSELTTLIGRAFDPGQRLELELERRKLQKEMMVLDVGKEAARLLG